MATSAVLLRMGEARVARDYLAWYSEHGVHANGLVSPILNDDGSVNTGFGSDIEYDSQGQYVTLVADVARLDGGPESVRAYLPRVKRRCASCRNCASARWYPATRPTNRRRSDSRASLRRRSAMRAIRRPPTATGMTTGD